MSLDGFFFSIKSAVHNIFRNSVLTIASVIVLGVCLLSLGSTMLVIRNVDMIVDSVGSENQIVIFLDESLSPAQIDNVGTRLGQIKNIQNITYESPQTSLDKYTAQLGESAVEGLDASVFRPSYIFDITDLNKYDQTVYEIKKIEGLGLFESGANAGQPAIRSSKEVIDSIVQIRQVLSFFSVVVVAIFLVLSLFIITNSVKLSVFSRRTEINIMKYVGATDFYIQLPYFVEGLLIGLFSGVLFFFIQRFVYNALLSPVLSDLMDGFTPFSFDSYFWIIFACFAGVGGIIGVIGSVFPVKKYLNV